ncbi:hypothetical protein GCM10023330_05660 [Litoribaculum gwangyangense]|uniref:Uncharacterized protein n=1 Tax=Litoribaculum gwangyangense TaxID=1130722 RepID=A0ABP9C3D3_9FLAO
MTFKKIFEKTIFTSGFALFLLSPLAINPPKENNIMTIKKYARVIKDKGNGLLSEKSQKNK